MFAKQKDTEAILQVEKLVALNMMTGLRHSDRGVNCVCVHVFLPDPLSLCLCGCFL